ncbi:hypothetical protein MtrunA17_Chr5g0428301 [Medicago truncatula]|uniref:Uncharacterized protein n=1 Tax=Medicago truncatula TaxID=3880 RepID=A0A396HSL4_MEDTR|nr:hypothetical protein MtrunA17_Chr5g0428301 [Medicago truncatula]
MEHAEEENWKENWFLRGYIYVEATDITGHSRFGTVESRFGTKPRQEKEREREGIEGNRNSRSSRDPSHNMVSWLILFPMLLICISMSS